MKTNDLYEAVFEEIKYKTHVPIINNINMIFISMFDNCFNKLESTIKKYNK